MNEQKQAIIRTVPAAEVLRKVPGFDPLKYLKRTTSPTTGEPVKKLDLAYKRLWFRLACPNGRMQLNPLRITDQLAIFEASIYAGQEDGTLISSFTSTRQAKESPGGRYIREAQDEALNEALDNAGFGIQLCDVAQVSDGSGFGSELPMTGETKDPAAGAPPEQSTVSSPTAVPSAPMSSVGQPTRESEVVKPAEPVSVAPTAVEKPTATPTAADVPQEQARITPTVTETPASPVVEQSTTPVETADLLQLLGGTPAAPAAPVETAASAAPVAAPTAMPNTADRPAPTPTPMVQNEPDAVPVTHNYNDSMAVEDILKTMTVEEARAVVVEFGTCKGWTLAQVQDRRPASLRFYLYGSDAGNVVKAASSLLLEEMTQRKAG